MPGTANALRWDGSPGHYEVYYLTLTDPGHTLEGDAVSGAFVDRVSAIDAERDQLAGVTYHDPDDELAYCYNSETARMRLNIYERGRQVGGWVHRATLVAPGRAHFEYAQRTPVPELELLTS